MGLAEQLAGQIQGRERLPLCQRMGTADKKAGLLQQQLRAPHTGAVRHGMVESDDRVQLPAEKPFQQGGIVQPRHRYFQSRVLLPQRRNDTGHFVQPKVFQNTHGDELLLPLHSPARLRLHPVERPLRVGKERIEPLAAGGQLHAPVGAHKQGQSQLPLQSCDLLAHCGLGDKELPRRFREIFRGAEMQEISNLQTVHAVAPYRGLL